MPLSPGCVALISVLGLLFQDPNLYECKVCTFKFASHEYKCPQCDTHKGSDSSWMQTLALEQAQERDRRERDRLDRLERERQRQSRGGGRWGAHRGLGRQHPW